jgi:fatty-acyl-CoA synthase
MDGPHPLLSYAHGVSSIPLLGETIGDNLRSTVERFGDREALAVRHRKERFTYRQLWDETTLVAGGLLALGVQPGDRVGIWSSNRSEWVIVQYATARIGAILVNVNPAYLAGELQYVLRQSGISVLLHADSFRSARYEPMLAGVRETCPRLRHVLHLDRDWLGLRQKGEKQDLQKLAVIESWLDFDEAINIQYTSGTTGAPKGSTLTHHNLLNNAYFTARWLGYTEADRVCIPVPFYHCFGMVLGNLACTSCGACMVVPSDSFNASATLAAIADERCTSLYGVPTMFRTLLEDPAFPATDCSSLRTGIMAGAPCPVELMRQVVSRLHMPEVAIGYGMTETSPLSTLSARDDTLEKRVGSVGRVLPHLEICIRDRDSGRIVPRGSPGEFCTRGYSVMLGYWEDEPATRAAIDSSGWMHSGDLAVMEPDGYVHIVGRLKDMIIRGGENISPREIEEVLHTHPAVAEVQVIGVPSAKYGEEVMAWVRLGPGERCDEQRLNSWCKERLAGYKVPRYWRFTDAFPMTVTGKIQKYRLRQMAVEILGRQADAVEKTA